MLFNAQFTTLFSLTVFSLSEPCILAGKVKKI